MKAGYLVAAVSLQDKWVEFSKGNIMPNNTQFIRRTPDTIEDELLLTIPSNLIQLEKDQYLMVQLSKTNSDIVEVCIEKDPRYQSKGIVTMHNYFDKEIIL